MLLQVLKQVTKFFYVDYQTQKKYIVEMKIKISKLPKWDLSDLYKTALDPQIDQDLKEANKKTENFDKKYRLRFNKKNISPKTLLQAIREYEEILTLVSKPLHFANLLFSQDSKTQKNGAFLQKTKTAYVEVSQKLLFFNLELSLLPEIELKKLQKDKLLENYFHFIKRLLDFKPHRLSEIEEKIFADKSLTSSSAFVRLFDEENSKKKFYLQIGKKIKVLTQSEILDLFHEPDRSKRKAAAIAISKGLNEDIDRLTFITNILAEDKRINDKYFKFLNPEDSRHLDNEINPDVVQTMVNTIVENYKVVEDFYLFKAKVLGLKKLETYDLYAPVTSSRKKVDYNKAQEMVLTAFKEFNEKYFFAGKEFFDKGWIDVLPKDGKRGGAFCDYGLPNHHPYILLNYTNNLRQVLTLAHELGHGIHARFFKNQPLLNFDTPLTIAETSSVFAEILVFDNLKKQITNKKELFSLYMGKIEDTFATVFRQVGMYRFEQELHNLRRTKGELEKREIGEIWQKTRIEMFGKAVNIDKNSSNWWSYIPHFIHTPFYVYAYAFGELLTLSLYTKYKKDGDLFVQKYLDFLKAGGSKSPDELLKPLGINLEDPDFWQGGINYIKDLVKEAKELYR